MSHPREFVELPRGMRARIEKTIEALVAVLDQLDGDADDEPSMGSVGGSDERGSQTAWAAGGAPIGEDEDGGDDEDSGDENEMTLAATTAINQDAAWRETRPFWSIPRDGELEPSLGWTGNGRGHPEIALRGYDDDREENIGPDEREGGDDNGIADLGGLCESWPWGLWAAE